MLLEACIESGAGQVRAQTYQPDGLSRERESKHVARVPGFRQQMGQQAVTVGVAEIQRIPVGRTG